jgi:hypothetical protein
MTATTRLLSAAAILGPLATAALLAGPLAPPAGPIAPTYKTLAEVQPRTPVQSLPGNADGLYVITQPGSYYLTGNIAASTVNQSAIRVMANDVTIDLCGFEIDGAGTAMAGIDAHQDTGAIAGLSVRNGSLANFWHAGINASGVTSCLFESVRVREPGGGICIQTGPSSVVHGCTVQGGDLGVYAEQGTHVEDCAINAPAYDGLYVLQGCSITRCDVYAAGDYGIAAFQGDCSITDCVVRGGNKGIRTGGGGNRVERCKVGQAGIAIFASFADTIVNNTLNSPAAGQGTGIYLPDGADRVEGNHVYGFDSGIATIASSSVNSNTMHSCTHPLNGQLGPLVAPVVTSAAALAANPVANIAQ